jgi:hypothetical protein
MPWRLAPDCTRSRLRQKEPQMALVVELVGHDTQPRRVMDRTAQVFEYEEQHRNET